MILRFNLKVLFINIILIFLFIIQYEVIASTKLDCKEKAFYVNDIISEAKDKDLTKAKLLAEEKYELLIELEEIYDKIKKEHDNL